MHNPFHTDPRVRWATSIEDLLDEATRPVPPGMKRFLPIYSRQVVRACADPLSEVATTLRDSKRSVPADALRQVIVFLSHAGESPLYADDPLRARWAADRLCVAIKGHTDQAAAREEVLA